MRLPDPCSVLFCVIRPSEPPTLWHWLFDYGHEMHLGPDYESHIVFVRLFGLQVQVQASWREQV